MRCGSRPDASCLARDAGVVTILLRTATDDTLCGSYVLRLDQICNALPADRERQHAYSQIQKARSMKDPDSVPLLEAYNAAGTSSARTGGIPHDASG